MIKRPLSPHNVSIGAAIAAALADLCTAFKRCFCGCSSDSATPKGQEETLPLVRDMHDGYDSAAHETVYSHSLGSLEEVGHQPRTRENFTQTSPDKSGYNINMTTNNIAIVGGAYMGTSQGNSISREAFDELMTRVSRLEQRSDTHEEAIGAGAHLMLASSLRAAETLSQVYRNAQGELLPASQRPEAVRRLATHDLSQVSLLANILGDDHLNQHLQNTVEQYVERLGATATQPDSSESDSG